MLIDLHCHEKTYSPCSNAALEDMVAEAKRKKLDAFCITDHDCLGLRERAHELSKVVNYPILVGVEIYTYEGDMVVFGLETVPDKRVHLHELLELIRRVKGVCVSAHPYRSNMRGLRDNLSVLKDYADIAGVEVRNGRTDLEANELARCRSKELSLFMTGGSDAHEINEVGCCATWLPESVTNETELIDALRRGASKAAVYKNGFYQVVETI